MYNVLEKVKAGEPLNDDGNRINDEGLVLVLKELHDKLDDLVFEAYGWAATLRDEEILDRLVALNKQRSLEEKIGNVNAFDASASRPDKWNAASHWNASRAIVL
jgi:hypothetical protein